MATAMNGCDVKLWHGTKALVKATGNRLAQCGRCHHKGQASPGVLAELQARAGRTNQPICFLAQKGGYLGRPPDAPLKVGAPVAEAGPLVAAVEGGVGGLLLWVLY